MDSSPFPDLNLLPFPKREPKPEPICLPEPAGPLETPVPPPLLPQNTSNSSSLLLASLQNPLSSNSDEDALFAEYYRLAHLFLSAAGAGAGAIVPAAPLTEEAAGAGAIVVSRKRKARSSEMVRVSSLNPRDQIYFRDLVRRARITYECLRTLLMKEEDKAETLGLLTRRTRADLRAAALMADRELWLNRDKRIIGSIPGIGVGDAFFFRMELCVLGLHGQVQAGIDYVSATRSASGEPVATSIIVSGGYEDDDDKGDMLIYTGHGGRDRNLNKHCIDQKLEGGNLALERSMTYGIEIRVIRGVKSDKSPTNKVYVYDGLYKVVECWMDVGKSGFGVYKYKMLRIEGQEEMGSGNLRLAEELKGNPLGMRPAGYLSLDISMGKENFPVLLFNDIDDDQDPLLFEYLTRPIFPASALQGKFGEGGGGCECTSNCSIGCYCAERNGGEFAYDGNGILLRGKPLVYECGPYCRCPVTCPNRVSQNGLRNRLEVFRSRETGWGVRSLDLIRAGKFICEFSGFVLTKQQSEQQAMNGSSLVYPNRFPARWLEWGDISDVVPDYAPPDFPCLPDLNFSIDVSRARNVACYVSHSCSPNVFVQFVLFDHYNTSYPHLMIFAMENIPPLRELSIDYGMIDEWVGKLML
ncbi:histone-lysine N-methyltransferase family member SUVH2-like [Typha angustifolia]|uniref:histone-lysine N-methyltransferase family member SUVH2-like n=1 Tax=Typha angustifolia TaxID=59011 RepID=UPI003C2F3BB9